MPTIFLLALAYQLQSHKWRYPLLFLAAINLIYHIFNQAWAQEVYSAVTLLLLFTLNPYFFDWWQKRNDRNNPSSFRQFCLDMYLTDKHNKFEIFFWLCGLLITIIGVCFYTGYTENAFLGWLLGIYIGLYVLKNLFYSLLPPEWFLHDRNTGYVFMSVLIAWGAAILMAPKLGTHFALPMILTMVWCLIGIYFFKGKTRFLVPGSAVILADLSWQIIRIAQSNLSYTPQLLITEFVLIIAMIMGLIWLFKTWYLTHFVFITISTIPFFILRI